MKKKFTLRIKTNDGTPMEFYHDTREAAEALLQNVHLEVVETMVALGGKLPQKVREHFVA